jgi:hypothetical protein
MTHRVRSAAHAGGASASAHSNRTQFPNSDVARSNTQTTERDGRLERTADLQIWTESWRNSAAAAAEAQRSSEIKIAVVERVPRQPQWRVMKLEIPDLCARLDSLRKLCDRLENSQSNPDEYRRIAENISAEAEALQTLVCEVAARPRQLTNEQ